MTKQTRQAIIVSCAMLIACLAAVVVGVNWNFIKAEYYFRFGRFKIPIMLSENISLRGGYKVPDIDHISPPELQKILAADRRARRSFLFSPNSLKVWCAAEGAKEYKELSGEEKREICGKLIEMLADTRSFAHTMDTAAWVHLRTCDAAVILLSYLTGRQDGFVPAPSEETIKCPTPDGREIEVPLVYSYGFVKKPEKAAEAIKQWKKWLAETEDDKLF